MSESHAFQAEISQMMHLIIHAFYSNKEIFLRELISNAADAIDKGKYAFFQNKGEDGGAPPEYRIRLRLDKSAKTILLSDNGIGMDREDIIQNLGTIAKSGTKAFLETLQERPEDMSLIGQFGVGFYSAFLVADRVQVYSRKRDAEADTFVCWESDAVESFTISEVTRAELPFEHPFSETNQSETHLLLHIKEAHEEFLEDSKVRTIIRTHNSFITYPIELEVTRSKDEQVPVEENEIVDPSETTVTTDASGVQTRTVTSTWKEWECLNKDKPVWLRSPEDVTEQEYMAVYRNISGELHKYSGLKHISGEGSLNFKGLLFTPARPSRDLYDSVKKKSTIKLYVKKVFITDQCSELLPEWLEFMFGAVDCEDLPLNVSRELLQGNKAIRMISKHIVKKSIELLTEIMEKGGDEWKEFYKNFSRSIKFGVNADSTHREKLLELLRYDSTHAEDEKTPRSLAQYVASMKEGQAEIYYITGERKELLLGSPFLEAMQGRGYEVLYMTDAIDEYVMQQVPLYQGKKFINISRAGFKLPGSEEEDSEAWENTVKSHEEVCKAVKQCLGDQVDKVVVVDHLVESPCSLANPESGWTANMERIVRAQALKTNMGMKVNRTLQLNPNHTIVRELKKRVDADTGTSTGVKDIVKLMYEVAAVSSGFSLDAPQDFVKRVFRMIQLGICEEEDASTEAVDLEAPMEEEDSKTMEQMEQID